MEVGMESRGKNSRNWEGVRGREEDWMHELSPNRRFMLRMQSGSHAEACSALLRRARDIDFAELLEIDNGAPKLPKSTSKPLRSRWQQKVASRSRSCG